MLGSTLGRYDGEGFIDNRMTAFGETLSGSEGSAPAEALRFFTGKPEVEGLGYAFLLRNYRANFGKWQTSDPLGYPDGWNNLAYVNNWVTGSVDWLGAYTRTVTETVAVGTPTYGPWSSQWYGTDPSTNMDIYRNTRTVSTPSQTITVTYTYDTTVSDQQWANMSLFFQSCLYTAGVLVTVINPPGAAGLGIALATGGLALTIIDAINGDTLVSISTSSPSETFTKTTQEVTYTYYPVTE